MKLGHAEEFLEKILGVLYDDRYLPSLGLSGFEKFRPYFSIASNLDRRHTYTPLGGSSELEGDCMIFLNFDGEKSVKVGVVLYNNQFLNIDQSRIWLEIRERLHYS